ncbi:hypothetical protein LTS01_026098, partial [Friedmanniomyces endolithicus]
GKAGSRAALRARPLPQGLLGHARPDEGQGQLREDPELRRAQGRGGDGGGAGRGRLPRQLQGVDRAGQEGVCGCGGGAAALLPGRRVV